MSDNELVLIQKMVDLLASAEPAARARILAYAMQRFEITPTHPAPTLGAPLAANGIFELAKKRKPARDVEMATLVAYYLQELAPEKERRDSISSDDIVKYFRQARFPLPGEARYTLKNAKNAGYLEAVSRGNYRITTTGLNYVEQPQGPGA